MANNTWNQNSWAQRIHTLHLTGENATWHEQIIRYLETRRKEKIKMDKFPKLNQTGHSLQLLCLKSLTDYIKNYDHYLHPSKVQNMMSLFILPPTIKTWIKESIIKYRLQIPKEYTFKCRINNCNYNNINEQDFKAHQLHIHNVTRYPYRVCPVCNIEITLTQSCYHMTTGNLPKWMKKTQYRKCWCGKLFHDRNQYQTHFIRSPKHGQHKNYLPITPQQTTKNRTKP